MNATTLELSLRARLPKRSPLFGHMDASAALAEGDLDTFLTVALDGGEIHAQRVAPGDPPVLLVASLTEYGRIDEAILRTAITVRLSVEQARTVVEKFGDAVTVHADRVLAEQIGVAA